MFGAGAVPSSLIGLVAFSFTLLAFGTVAYTVSLPSLVAAAGHSDGDSLFHVISAQMFGAGAGDSADFGDPAAWRRARPPRSMRVTSCTWEQRRSLSW